MQNQTSIDHLNNKDSHQFSFSLYYYCAATINEWDIPMRKAIWTAPTNTDRSSNNLDEKNSDYLGGGIVMLAPRFR